MLWFILSHFVEDSSFHLIYEILYCKTNLGSTVSINHQIKSQSSFKWVYVYFHSCQIQSESRIKRNNNKLTNLKYVRIIFKNIRFYELFTKTESFTYFLVILVCCWDLSWAIVIDWIANMFRDKLQTVWIKAFEQKNLISMTHLSHKQMI